MSLKYGNNSNYYDYNYYELRPKFKVCENEKKVKRQENINFEAQGLKNFVTPKIKYFIFFSQYT